MKPFFIIPLLAIILVSCSQVTDYFKKPVVYNDEIIDIYNVIIDEYTAYDTYYTETSWEYYDKVEERRLTTINNINQKIVELEMVGSFRNDSIFVDTAIESSNGIIGVLKTHDSDLMGLWRQLYNEEISQDEYTLTSNRITSIASAKLTSISDNFSNTQIAFASKYSYEIEEVDETEKQ